MSRPASNHLWTSEDLFNLADDGVKHELQAGLLVSEPLPGTRHGHVALHLGALLDAHVRRHRLGVALGNDSGFILSRSPDTVRGPDVSFVSRSRFDDLRDTTKAFPGAPDLAVEVLSPTNTPASIHAKVADYLAAGTRRVWVVDPEMETVVVYRSLLSPNRLETDDILDGEDVVPGFRVCVREIFEV